MKKKITFYGLIFITIVNLSSLATMLYFRFKPQKHMVIIQKKCTADSTLCADLLLSDAQETELLDSKEEYCTKIIMIHEPLQEKRIELIDLLKSSDPDTKRIEILLNEIDSMQAAIEKETIRNLLDEKKILKPDQQEKYFSKIKDELLKQSELCQEKIIVISNDSCQEKSKKIKIIKHKEIIK